MKSLLKLLVLLFCFLFFLVTLPCIFMDVYVPISMQLNILNTLVNVSSIVFGLMGVWLAVVYSDTLKIIFDNNLKVKEKREKVKNFEYLSQPMMVAALIVIYVILFKLMYPILIQIEILYRFQEIIQTLSFLIISVLCLAQIWTVIYIFAPAENIRNKAHEHMDKQEHIESTQKNTKSVKK